MKKPFFDMRQLLVRFTFLSLVFLFIVHCDAQVVNRLSEFQLKQDAGNVTSTPLGSDSLSSAFLIVIKVDVKSHKHEHHTENIYVIDGEGQMKLGDKQFNIQPGDHVFIPKNTYHSVTVVGKKPLKILSVQSPMFDGSDRVWEER